MSSWRLPAPPQSDTATEGAANTFPGGTRPCLSQRLPHCCGTLRANVPVWFSPEYLFDLIFPMTGSCMVPLVICSTSRQHPGSILAHAGTIKWHTMS
jgi:hypothetical protein